MNTDAALGAGHEGAGLFSVFCLSQVALGTQFSCRTGTKAQTLTQKALFLFPLRVVSVELLQDAVHQGWAEAAT